MATSGGYQWHIMAWIGIIIMTLDVTEAKRFRVEVVPADSSSVDPRQVFMRVVDGDDNRDVTDLHRRQTTEHTTPFNDITQRTGAVTSYPSIHAWVKHLLSEYVTSYPCHVTDAGVMARMISQRAGFDRSVLDYLVNLISASNKGLVEGAAPCRMRNKHGGRGQGSTHRPGQGGGPLAGVTDEGSTSPAPDEWDELSAGALTVVGEEPEGRGETWGSGRRTGASVPARQSPADTVMMTDPGRLSDGSESRGLDGPSQGGHLPQGLINHHRKVALCMGKDAAPFLRAASGHLKDIRLSMESMACWDSTAQRLFTKITDDESRDNGERALDKSLCVSAYRLLSRHHRCVQHSAGGGTAHRPLTMWDLLRGRESPTEGAIRPVKKGKDGVAMRKEGRVARGKKGVAMGKEGVAKGKKGVAKGKKSVSKGRTQVIHLSQHSSAPISMLIDIASDPDEPVLFY